MWDTILQPNFGEGLLSRTLAKLSYHYHHTSLLYDPLTTLVISVFLFHHSYPLVPSTNPSGYSPHLLAFPIDWFSLPHPPLK